MWAAIGRNGFAATLALSVTLHAAAAVWFSLEATEPPIAFASLAGKASMSIRASAGARPRVVGDGASAGPAIVGAASADRPARGESRSQDGRSSLTRPADHAPPPTEHRSGETAPERNDAAAPPRAHVPSPETRDAAVAPAALPDHATGHTITALAPASGADHSRADAAPMKPTPPRVDKEAPSNRAETPPVRSASPPTQIALAPIRKAGEGAPTPNVASAPSHAVTPKEQVATAGNHPSAKPGRPTLPGLENAKNVAEEASPSSAGSAGSEGVEADDLPQGLAVNPPPPYPDDALANRLEGTVLLWVKIDATGRVSSIRLQESSGVESLDRSALTTIRRWQFSPAKRRGVPVPFEFYWPVRFRIPVR